MKAEVALVFSTFVNVLQAFVVWRISRRVRRQRYTVCVMCDKVQRDHLVERRAARVPEWARPRADESV